MAGLPAIASYPLPDRTGLPVSVAPWQLDADRAVLLVHDMQRYFLAPFPESIRTPLVENCRKIRLWCDERNVPVFFTAQPGDMSEQQRGLLKDIWGPGMRAAPADREVVEELKPRASDILLTKWRYSAFHQSDLLERMRNLGRDQLVICGVYAHVGILVTAIEAFSHDIQPFLIADAIADFTADHHRMAIEYAAGRCAVVITAAELAA
ncbi:isochorismatase family protein (plasmid) [Rhizobium leguminosarum]|uniref:isochorismatase family protein n=1 Tax=Rhizobium leguminosarum TaxID=384 RepID=UPI00048798D3|nr:isochorismatase family protein [Rhizobium leguminosarum]UIK01238.1 isochorismatase family protein [Rhizobium leguminosarum]UIK14159.1 isochorismatase family protein [Rhizobium leguminosarum]UIL30285.1 isochorismatase family protein [Rhizobium leguminosarum]WFT90933.1 isochorismatase family protein [Rhizobium leguminosarum]